jgi:hypothetical protein
MILVRALLTSKKGLMLGLGPDGINHLRILSLYERGRTERGGHLSMRGRRDGRLVCLLRGGIILGSAVECRGGMRGGSGRRQGMHHRRRQRMIGLMVVLDLIRIIEGQWIRCGGRKSFMVHTHSVSCL